MVRFRRACVLLLPLVAVAASGQAVTEWRTPFGLPAAIVEVPGGDLEHFAALVPLDAPVPQALGGFATSATPVPLGRLWTVSVPALVSAAVLREAEAALAASGAAGVVILGPVPARELVVGSSPLGGVPFRPVARPVCILAEGEVEIRRGSPERLELVLPVPGPDDPRFDLLPALEDLVRLRLARRWPEISTALDTRDGCERLVVRLPAPDQHPWDLIAPLRAELQAIASTPPSPDEVTEVSAVLARRVAGWAVDGLTASRALLEQLALGGRISAALAPPALDADALAALVRGVLAGHAGMAVIYEQERRAVSEAPSTLPNGVLLSWRWVAARIGVVGVALGGMQPGVAGKILQGTAGAAARAGWQVKVATVAGVPALAVVAPADELIAVLETLADALQAPVQPIAPDWADEVTGRVGLTSALAAEAVSLSIALPPEVEEAKEAAAKFFSDFSAGGVRSGLPLAGPGLSWTQTDEPPVVTAIVDVPPTAAGWVAGQLLLTRLGAQPGVRVRWLNLPGRLVLEVTAAGEGHVPGLDERLAGQWKKLVAPADEAEVRAAAQTLITALFGDAAQATLRLAAEPFLPAVPRQEELLGVEAKEVAATLAALPGWMELPRMARGAAPLVVVPPEGPRSVRKSPARRPR